MTEIEILRLMLNPGALILAIVAYGFRFERRLSRIEGKLAASSCKFNGCPLTANGGAEDE